MDISNWQIPSYDVSFWNGRKHDFCVVIPVINEGQRIRDLLEKMSLLKIESIADIIIVDGGSRDGSLETSFLDKNHVAGLIIKTGPGKLSAQLRCAYSFALKNDYKGIVTIDGNDKDDPKAIPKFITALEESYDFVQGSRFVDGGFAENTPASRDFAIRFIHAPMLRFASGFKWTDTTQGFRGYSRKMLMDPNIAPFRNVFDTYELLAYLSYRAPLLGFKCIEVGSSRKYPLGDVPTKISSFRGNLSVFKILVKACLGKYNHLK